MYKSGKHFDPFRIHNNHNYYENKIIVLSKIIHKSLASNYYILHYVC